jgi:hypothetical protein
MAEAKLNTLVLFKGRFKRRKQSCIRRFPLREGVKGETVGFTLY